MSSAVEAPGKRRCRAKTKRGEPCAATVVGADGLCSAHSGRQDMRELGRKGGKGRSRPNPERVHESLRTYLKREVPPARVWEALEAAMLGNNESARVSASRVLLDALHEPEEQDWRKRYAAEVGEARAKFDELVTRRAAAASVQRAATIDEELDLAAAVVSEHEDPALIAAVESARTRLKERLEARSDAETELVKREQERVSA